MPSVSFKLACELADALKPTTYRATDDGHVVKTAAFYEAKDAVERRLSPRAQLVYDMFFWKR